MLEYGVFHSKIQTNLRAGPPRRFQIRKDAGAPAIRSVPVLSSHANLPAHTNTLRLGRRTAISKLRPPQSPPLDSLHRVVSLPLPGTRRVLRTRRRGEPVQ